MSEQEPQSAREPIIVGFDGSPESVAASEWAAREAARRRRPLELVQAWPWPSAHVLGGEDAITWAKERLARKEVELQALLAGVEVSALHIPDVPTAVLETAAKQASMLVLGSRGLGALQGYLVGSVSQDVLGRAACPVVLVRAGRTAEDDHLPGPGGQPATDTPYREVAVGIDLQHPWEEVLGFAFQAAAFRAAPLRVVHAWGPPRGDDYFPFSVLGEEAERSTAVEQRLAEALRPWRATYPQVEVTARALLGSAAVNLLESASGAALLVVGRRSRRSPVGAHLGPVAHAVIHHAPCPVAVVPYG